MATTDEEHRLRRAMEREGGFKIFIVFATATDQRWRSTTSSSAEDEEWALVEPFDPRTPNVEDASPEKLATEVLGVAVEPPTCAAVIDLTAAPADDHLRWSAALEHFFKAHWEKLCEHGKRLMIGMPHALYMSNGLVTCPFLAKRAQFFDLEWEPST